MDSPPTGNPGRELRGGAIVNAEMTGQTYIVFRWDPARKYDSVRKLFQTFISTKFNLQPVDEDPTPQVADASAAQVAASAAQAAASAAQPARQRLPAGSRPRLPAIGGRCMETAWKDGCEHPSVYSLH